LSTTSFSSGTGIQSAAVADENKSNNTQINDRRGVVCVRA
jgi:hypothetical protein